MTLAVCIGVPPYLITNTPIRICLLVAFKTTSNGASISAKSALGIKP